MHSLVTLGIFLQSLLVTESSPSIPSGEVSMGTTILAIRYNGGVVVGADTRVFRVRYKNFFWLLKNHKNRSRTSVSGYVSNRYAAKLTFILDRELDSFVTPSIRRYHNRKQSDEQQELIEKGDHESQNKMVCRKDVQNIASGTEYSLMKLEPPEGSTCVVCRSGSAADTQHLASIIRADLVSRQLLYRIPGSVTNVASLLWNLLSNDSSLSASLICAGYDHELRRGVIYSIAPGGTVFEESMWAAGGSGSTYILGYLDSYFSNNSDEKKEKLFFSEEEAMDLVYNALCLAMDRDGSSGGFVRMYVIDRYGRKYVTRMVKRST